MFEDGETNARAGGKLQVPSCWCRLTIIFRDDTFLIYCRYKFLTLLYRITVEPVITTSVYATLCQLSQMFCSINQFLAVNHNIILLGCSVTIRFYILLLQITLNRITVEPGYNDIGLCDTSSIASDILWHQSFPNC
jgi:hypothetical protein